MNSTWLFFCSCSSSCSSASLVSLFLIAIVQCDRRGNHKKIYSSSRQSSTTSIYPLFFFFSRFFLSTKTTRESACGVKERERERKILPCVFFFSLRKVTTAATAITLLFESIKYILNRIHLPFETKTRYTYDN